MTQTAKNSRFIASGDQGCVYKNFPATCDLQNNGHNAGDLVTKVISSKDAYDKEVATAEILQKHPNDFTVHARRACSVNLEALNDDVKALLNECQGKNNKIKFVGTAYIVEMPYVEHVTLKQLATSHSIDHETGKQYFRELENAIRNLHAWGICHSDLHDKNVWIVGMDRESGKSGHIMIADFGTAKFSNAAAEKANDIRTAIPSFKAIWTAVTDKRGVRPGDIERQMNVSGAFFNWSYYENVENQRPRITVTSPVAQGNLFGTPASSSRRRPRSSPSRMPSQTKKATTRALSFADDD